MKSLLLTEYELVYLLAQIIWNTQGVIFEPYFFILHNLDAEGLSEEGQETAEKTAEQIANEVHNYYVYERSMENYAPRLIKLSKLMEAAKVRKGAIIAVFKRYFRTYSKQSANSS